MDASGEFHPDSSSSVDAGGVTSNQQVEENGEHVLDEENQEQDSDESCEPEKVSWDLDAEEQPSSWFSREKIRHICCPPHGFTTMLIPLALSLTALILTTVGSYDCSFFQGAGISFTGGHYGIWTLEDGTGKCQLWDVLFFSYDLGGPLIAARTFSMACLLFGLGLVATMLQALEFQAASWGVFFAFFVLFLVSVSTTSIYNIWIVFWMVTYVIYILIIRWAFIHPVHRQISKRGVRFIAGLLLLCAVNSLLTLVILKSDFCTCENLTPEELAGRDPGAPCEQQCHLGAAGSLMIVSSAFWIAAAWAVLRYGVQPEEAIADQKQTRMYRFYPKHSLTTRAKRMIELSGSEREKAGQEETTESELVKIDVGVETTESELAKIDVGVETTESELARIDVGVSESVENEDEKDTRSCISKACCDYRVMPRSRKERWAFWAFRTMLGFIVGVYVFIIVMLIGTRLENTNAAKAPDTSYNFILDEVCAFNPLDTSQPFETFPSKQDAENAGYDVAHCGACASCSNPSDIKAYVETRKTIAKTSKKCGIYTVSLFGDYGDLVDCLQGRIGFTRSCTECWADNMLNTKKNCLWTCMTTLFTGFMASNNVAGAGDRGWLNQCLFCDEKLSGPDFVACSGVARRRLGIESEIERNPATICQKNDVDWLNVTDWTELFPESDL